MSDFDKYVAQWVSRAGDNLSKEVREQLLSNIHESLDDYEVLRDPTAARARREAAAMSKQREEEKKQQENAKKVKEEQDRKRQERQANLPPLPPSKTTREEAPAASASAAEPATKAKKKKVAGKKSTVAGKSQKSSSAAAAGPESAASKDNTAEMAAAEKERELRRAKRRPAGAVEVKNIDFKFGERVDEQLKQLEQEKTAKPATPTTTTTTTAAAQPASTTTATAASKKVRISPVVTTTEPLPAAASTEEVKEEPQETAASLPLPPAAAAAAPPSAEEAHVDPEAEAPLKAACKRSSPPPLDQVAADHAALENRMRTPHEEEEKHQEERNGVAHDAQSDDDDDASVPSFEETRNYQEQLNAFHFASVGDEPSDDDDRSDVVAAEEEFIDDREDVRRRTMQMQRPSRPAISDSTLDIDEARIANFPTTPKSQNKVKTISRVLVRHFLFSTLDDSDIAKFASIMDLEKFEAGEKLLTKGEPNDTFYIVLDGEAEMVEVNEGEEETVVPLVRGSTCGDVALMYEVKNDADVVARTPLQCATLERRTYKMITSRAMEEKRKRYIDFLSTIPLFEGLSPFELERVAEMLKEDSYVEGQKVIAYGVPNHWLHIVMEGTLRIVSPDAESGEEREVALAHRGQVVGEIEFIYHHLPVASVFAASPVVKTAKLSRRSFELVPSEVRERLVHIVEDDTSYASYHRRMHSASPPAYDMTPPFDAPPASVQRSMHHYSSEHSESTSAAARTPTPPPLTYESAAAEPK